MKYFSNIKGIKTQNPNVYQTLRFCTNIAGYSKNRMSKYIYSGVFHQSGVVSRILGLLSGIFT